MEHLTTNHQLLEALQRAAGRRLSAAEIHQQRVSYIHGFVKDPSSVTEARIEQVLKEQKGD